MLLSPTTTFGSAQNASFGPNGSTFNGIASIALDTVYHRLFVSDTANSGPNRRILVFQLEPDNTLASLSASYVLGAPNFNVVGYSYLSANTVSSSTFANICFDSKNIRLFVADYAGCVRCFDVRPGVIANGMAASFVLGQPSFTNAGTGVASQTEMAVGIDDLDYDSVNDRLIVADRGANRVMVFSTPPGSGSSINGSAAICVLGQPDFVTVTAGCTQSKTSATAGIAYAPDDSIVYVCDSTNNRILGFSLPASATSAINGENALVVLGQSNFTNSGTATTQAGLSGPDDICYNKTTRTLFVSDTANVVVKLYAIPVGISTSNNGMNAADLVGSSSWTAAGTTLVQKEAAASSMDQSRNQAWWYAPFGTTVGLFNFIQVTGLATVDAIVNDSWSTFTPTTANTSGTTRTWSVSSGTLPTGLSINSSTGAITGTPTVVGTTTITLQALDNTTTGAITGTGQLTIPVLAVDATAAYWTGTTDGNWTTTTNWSTSAIPTANQNVDFERKVTGWVRVCSAIASTVYVNTSGSVTTWNEFGNIVVSDASLAIAGGYFGNATVMRNAGKMIQGGVLASLNVPATQVTSTGAITLNAEILGAATFAGNCTVCSCIFDGPMTWNSLPGTGTFNDRADLQGGTGAAVVFQYGPAFNQNGTQGGATSVVPSNAITAAGSIIVAAGAYLFINTQTYGTTFQTGVTAVINDGGTFLLSNLVGGNVLTLGPITASGGTVTLDSGTLSQTGGIVTIAAGASLGAYGAVISNANGSSARSIPSSALASQAAFLALAASAGGGITIQPGFGF
jgi:hypothetical protein